MITLQSFVMKVLIIEDEALAQERVQYLLSQCDTSIQVLACIDSVEDTLLWLQNNEPPDLFIMDIHLSDGLSFDIFKNIQINQPVIFTTAYDQYAIEAFSAFSIDYILKPVSRDSLCNAINKYKNITEQFAKPNYQELAELSNAQNNLSYKSRFLAKVGQRLFMVDVNDISYFYTDNKVLFIVDKKGGKFVLSTTIEKLEPTLNPKDFFRINRKIIVRADAMQQIKPYLNSRLQVNVIAEHNANEMIISRERVNEFKTWAEAY